MSSGNILHEWGDDVPKESTSGDPFSQIVDNITRLNSYNRQIKDVHEKINVEDRKGRDREKLKKLRESSKEVILQTSDLLLRPFSQDQKVRHGKLLSQFQTAVSHFEELSRNSLYNDKNFIANSLKTSSTTSSLGSDVEANFTFSAQIELIPLYGDQELIDEMNTEIQEIEKDLNSMNQVMRDLNQMVTVQGENLTQVETNTVQTEEELSNANKELAEAYRTQQQIRKTKVVCIFWALVLLLVLVLAVAIPLSMISGDL